MKLATLLTATASLCLTAIHAADQNLYLAAGDAISVHKIDPKTGKLTPVDSVALKGAGPFTFSHDGKRLYAMAADGKSPQIATLEVKPSGTLSLLHVDAVKLRAGYLKVDRTGQYIAGNHYGPGKASLWKLDGGVYRGTTAQELPLEEKAHSAVFSADNRWLLVPATGPNKVFVNAFHPEEGKLTPNKPPFGSGPAGEDEARQPRHLILHPAKKDILYTTNEREHPGVCVWKWDGEKGTLEPIQNIRTAPDQFEGRISTADLHITPNAKFLYVSNRNIVDRKSKPVGKSSIVGFRVDAADGRLTMIGHTPCENVPRSFCIDQTGKFVYVAGQIDNRLGVYAIDQDSGNLTKIEQHEVGKRPIWVETR